MSLLGIGSAEDEAEVMKKKIMEAGVTDEDFAAAEGSQAGGGLLSPAMQAPRTPGEQAKENYSGLELFGRQLGARFLGGMFKDQALPEYSDANKAKYKSDLELYQKRRETKAETEAAQQALAGIDMDNLSMADVVTISKLGPNVGKYALEEYQFGRQVADLGKAQGFLNDGIEDEKDLWAREANLRYGRTGGGQQTSLTDTLKNAQMTPAEFELLPAEAQRAVLYQHGTDEDRRTMDRVAGRQTTDQITADARAKERGVAVGRQVGEDRKTIISSRGAVQAMDQQSEKLSEVIGQLENKEINTGIGRIFRDTLNLNNYADGKVDAVTAQGVIDMISQATFGALSQSELDLLKGGIMDPTKSAEYNIGTLNSALERIKDDREKAIGSAKAASGRYSEESDYEQLMQDDWTYLNVGSGSDIKGFTTSSGKEANFQDFYNAKSEQGFSRDEIVSGYNDMRKAEQAKIKEQEELAKQQKEAAAQALSELTDTTNAGMISPYIRRGQ